MTSTLQSLNRSLQILTSEHCFELCHRYEGWCRHPFKYLFPLESPPNLDDTLSSGFSPFSDSGSSLSRLSEAKYGPTKQMKNPSDWVCNSEEVIIYNLRPIITKMPQKRIWCFHKKLLNLCNTVYYKQQRKKPSTKCN